MRLVVVALAAALSAALLAVGGVRATKAQTAQASGTVVAWGYNYSGQTNVPPNLTGVEAVDAGGFHNLALREDGTVVAWGSNDAGQSTVPAGLTGVEAISAGYVHSLALKNDGTVVAWGSNSAGQRSVPAGLTNVVAISAGGQHSLALKDDGTVVAWGRNDVGQGSVPRNLTGVTAIDAGGYHNLALKDDGTVVAWGYDEYAQGSVPPGLASVEAINAGWMHNLALKEDGTVVAWGRNDAGQTHVPPGLTGVGAISAGLLHSLALKEDGTVVAWGGGPAASETNVPHRLTGVEAISSGLDHNLALVVDHQDTISPNIRAALDPAIPDGRNGWYTGDVSVSWTAADEESAISGRTGCDTQSVAADTAGLTLTCSATSAGGTSSESVTIKRDATSPRVDFVSRAPAANSNGWNNTDVTVEWSCNDTTSGAVDPSVTQTLNTEAQNQSAVGTCTDNAGNTASDTQTGINIDKTAPILDPAGSPDPVLLNGTVAATANATDALSGIASQSCAAADTSETGYKTAVCTATDLAGNTATANARYLVVYDFAGFSEPVDNLDANGDPVLNEVKAGQAIPLKWRLTDASGAAVTTLRGAQISVASISCSSGSTLDKLEEIAPGDSGVQNLGNGYYRLNWKSPSSYANSCKRLRLDLSEGSAASPVHHSADFRFTR